jgi:hypothetical protein
MTKTFLLVGPPFPIPRKTGEKPSFGSVAKNRVQFPIPHMSGGHTISGSQREGALILSDPP